MRKREEKKSVEKRHQRCKEDDKEILIDKISIIELWMNNISIKSNKEIDKLLNNLWELGEELM